jgi:hypothetical protein
VQQAQRAPQEPQEPQGQLGLPVLVVQREPPVQKEHNDLAAHADKLRGDDLVLIRVVGTLSIGLAEIGSCIYDADQSLRTPEVIGDMLGTVLVLYELEA